MDLNVNGRVALVSGASSGIGAGVARVLAREGVRLAVTARRVELLEKLAAEIVTSGGDRPFIVAGNIADADDVSRVVAATTAALGPVDILVNSAGGSRPISADAPDAAWDEAFALNFTAARRLTEAVLPSMRA